MSKEKKEDILFQIHMQLYDEFNDKIATMNDHLGDIYSLRDIEEVEKAEKDKEIKLLREAVEKQQKELEKKDIELKECERNLIDERTERIKKDKIIDEMAEQLEKCKNEIDILSEGNIDCFIPREFSNINDCVKRKNCKECIIDYFTKKVEMENK